MGNPAIFYYPDIYGSLEEIDLVDISLIESTSERFRTDEEGITRSVSVTDYGMRHTYRIARERFAGGTVDGEDLVEKLRTFENHAQRGGFFAFAADRDKAWGGFLDARYQRGATVLSTRGNVFGYNDAAALSAGDRVIIQSANPEGKLERHRIASQTGDRIDLASGLVNKFLFHPVVIRQRDFFPMLRMQAGARPILTDDHRTNYTMEIECYEDVASMFVFANYGGALTGPVPSSGARSKSPQAAIESLRNRDITTTSTTLERPRGS